MISFNYIGYSQFHESRNGQSTTGCSVFALYYAVVVSQLRENVFNSALLSRVIDFATPLYHQYISQQQQLSPGHMFTAADAAIAAGLTADDYDEIGGLVVRDTHVAGVDFKSLYGALTEIVGDFFGIVTIGASSRAVARVGDKFLLLDSHGSLSNGAVPSDEQTQDYAICLRFDGVDSLLACINSFRDYADDDIYSLVLLTAESDRVRRLFDAINGDATNAPTTTTTTATSSATTTTAKTYAAVAAAAYSPKNR